ncbi:MAG: PQQ-dependent sugar dehydrogenase, partial [Nitrospirae bacterium]|nr:PQQ-dependent sugar dehydrogenase [Nitrospirota bacterium]
VEGGRLLPDPFLDLQRRVESGGEKGLLGLVFHPRYRENGAFYVNYTTREKGELYTLVSRFQRRSLRRADPGSEQILLKIRQPYSNHNGGHILFGPDGYLYIGMGDGGSGNDPQGHGQNPASLLGKLLRIDVGHREGDNPYAIPPDNPYVGRPGYRPEIWALGLRNPWRFSFDAGNGKLYLADVGQDRVEEIDVIVRGRNYGWNVMEGDLCTPGVNPRCDPSGLEAPLFTYRHPEGFAVTGGFVYRGSAVPGLCGTYLFADYVTGRLWGLRDDGHRVITHRELMGAEGVLDKVKRKLRGDSPAGHISSFGQDEVLELYVTDHEAGRVLKIAPASP